MTLTGVQDTVVKPDTIDIKAETMQTCIYSDGSAHVETRKGACATIISFDGKHFIHTRALRGDQGKKSYHNEMEKTYLGTSTAALIDK